MERPAWQRRIGGDGAPDSGSGTTTALSTGFAASMRAIALSASSTGVTSPSATRSRSATASSHPRSSAGTGGAYAVSHEHLVQPGDVKEAGPPRSTGRRSAAGTARSTRRRSAAGNFVLRCVVQRPRSPSIPWRGTTVCSTGLVPVIPTVTVHQPPVAMPDCIRPPEWLQHWDPFAPPGVNGGRTGYAWRHVGKNWIVGRAGGRRGRFGSGVALRHRGAALHERESDRP